MRWIGTIVFAALCVAGGGCAESGAAFDGTATSTDDGGDDSPGDDGGDTTGTASGDDTGSDTGDPDVVEDVEADTKPPLPDVPDVEEDIDPNADWICDEDDGVVDIVTGDCNWTWTCNVGEYTITCTQVQGGGGLTCQCRHKGITVFKPIPADETCNAQSTVNTVNAYCDWKLPLPD